MTEPDGAPRRRPLSPVDAALIAEACTKSDLVWVRPLDVCALLGGRSYALEVEVVLQVADPLLGDGSYLLKGGPDGATCTRTERAADVALGVGALGAVCLGGTRLATLARAGVVRGADDALRRLDLALLADRLPFHGTHI